MSLAPSFRAEFIRQSAWAATDELRPSAELLGVKMSAPKPAPSCAFKTLVLPQLDLNTVAGGKDEPPVSESILKRSKLASFEKECSQVSQGLYVSGEYVAKSREVLQRHGITHVVNCVGALYPEYFRADGIAYRTLWLQGGGCDRWNRDVLGAQRVGCRVVGSRRRKTQPRTLFLLPRPF
jgi:hypothetical protein